MEFRKIFDTIPEQFDRYRPRYCPALFEYLIHDAGIGPGKRVLEIGPGTGQATDPILQTGCDYHAIELGEHLCAKMREKYDRFPNFHLVHDDFITHDFGQQRFDMVYSAATIQWIPEEVAFSKTFELLKPGGVLAMMLTRSDYRTPNEALYEKIQQLYAQYYKPDIPYTQRTAVSGMTTLRIMASWISRSMISAEGVKWILTNMFLSAAPTATIS